MHVNCFPTYVRIRALGCCRCGKMRTNHFYFYFYFYCYVPLSLSLSLSLSRISLPVTINTSSS